VILNEGANAMMRNVTEIAAYGVMRCPFWIGLENSMLEQACIYKILK